MPRTGQPAVRHVESVARAATVLDALAGCGEDTGTTELARLTGINASSVSRLLATLAAVGLVQHLPATGRYRLGLRLVELGNAALARLDLRDLAAPHLAALVAETGETATLSVPAAPEAVTVDFHQSASSVQSVARVGRPSVAHATATGKVFLAWGGVLPEGPLAAYTPRTVTDPESLAAEVGRVRRRGWAQAVGEREPDLHAVAVPVRGPRGELVAILGVQGPSSRFRRAAMAAALEALRGHAAALQAGVRPR